MGEEDVELAATFAETSTPEPADNLTAIHLNGATTDDRTEQHNRFMFDDVLLGSHTNGSSASDLRTRSFTYSAWIKVNEARGRVMGYGQRDFWGPTPTFHLLIDGGYYTLYHRGLTATGGFGNDQTTTTSQAVELGEWAFVTVVFDEENASRAVYYNGEEILSGPYTGEGLGMLPDVSAFYVCDGTPGSNSNYSNDPDMELDEVQVWTRALTADEVLASMDSVDPSADGLAYLYRFGADRMNEDYTFDNLATSAAVTEDVPAAYYNGTISYDNSRWATIFNGTISQPTFVEGHITAAPENYEVTWTAPENGTLTIMNGDVELTSGALVAEGTELTVIAAPAFGYQLDAVTVNDETLEGTTFTVTGATVVAATFVPVQLEEWPHDTTGQAANGNPSVHPSEDRYVTSATTTGAAIDLNWTNSERPSTWYINTGAMMQAEQGTTFDLRMQSAEDMIWCHAVIFVDWNGDKDFDDEGEMIAKVGLDHVDDGAGGSFFQTGNPDLVDFTQTIEVPVDMGSIPLFVRSNAIIPMAANQMYNLMNETVTGIQLLCAADKDNSFTLYEDDGVSMDYEKGGFLKTHITMKAGEKTTLDFVREGSYETSAETMFIDMIHREKSPFWVTVDGELIPHFLHRRKFEEAACGWYYSQRLKSVQLKYKNPKKDYQVVVSFEQFDLIGM